VWKKIALFGQRLLVEVEQRGTFEPEHGEGTFQDIGEDRGLQVSAPG
jgi:hypothetical protein